MGRKYGPVLGFWLIASWTLCGALEKDPGDPANTVRSLLDAVRALSEAEEEASEAKAIQRISGTFDIVDLSRDCLRRTWEDLSAEEQKNFVSLFQEVLEKVAYPNSAKFFKDTVIEVESVTRENGKARVSTLVVHPREGEVEVEYCLGLSDGAWLIEDIFLDGVSLRVDLRSQAQRIIREESYEELKRRLRDRLDEL